MNVEVSWTLSLRPLGVRPTDIYVLQLEQELRLCLQREDAKTAFLNEWGKFVPTIIHYCEKSKKKTLSEYAKEIDHTGTCIHIVKIVCDIDRHHTDDETLQISALKTLVTALSPKGMKDSYLVNLM